jgi:hypothetical protein
MIAITFSTTDSRYHLMAPGLGHMVLPAGCDAEEFGRAIAGQIAAESGVQLPVVLI